MNNWSELQESSDEDVGVVVVAPPPLLARGVGGVVVALPVLRGHWMGGLRLLYKTLNAILHVRTVSS